MVLGGPGQAPKVLPRSRIKDLLRTRGRGTHSVYLTISEMSKKAMSHSWPHYVMLLQCRPSLCSIDLDIKSRNSPSLYYHQFPQTGTPRMTRTVLSFIVFPSVFPPLRSVMPHHRPVARTTHPHRAPQSHQRKPQIPFLQTVGFLDRNFQLAAIQRAHRLLWPREEFEALRTAV